MGRTYIHYNGTENHDTNTKILQKSIIGLEKI